MVSRARYGPKRGGINMRGGNFAVKSFVVCTVQHSLEMKSGNKRWVGLVTLIGKRSAYRVLVRKPGGNNRLG